MIIWGGTDGSQELGDGAAYNPVAKSWTTLTATGAPSARKEHTAVWTGTEMIVWGGVGGGTRLNTGGHYDPSGPGWSPTSTGTNLPAARHAHTAVWTGDEMIVWGGRSDAGRENTGGRYHPLTDSWNATSTGTGVPSARREHTAVWTGTEMIVWGGSEIFYVYTGGRYDPLTDSWNATSIGANVPAGRREHTAIWTGNEMIVWGGYGGSYLNSGGRYDPSDDTWLATSMGPDLPLVRSAHTAVWTGNQMIVWGGGKSTLPRYLNSGAGYAPNGDAWTPTGTEADLPQGRRLHTAVYTDQASEQMIVWGGFPLTATGGLYCVPCTTAAWYPDADGDGYGDPGGGVSACVQPIGYIDNDLDCDDGSGVDWQLPDEATDLTFAFDTQSMDWQAPANPGSSDWFYDTIRSGDPSDFDLAGTCVEWDDGSDTQAMDTGIPGVDAVYFYLVRAGNGCGDGSMGFDSDGAARPAGKPCP